MIIFISTSATFYNKVAPVMQELKSMGHDVIPPNGYGENVDESIIRENDTHQAWKEKMLRQDIRLVESCDAILVLNYEKNGQPNYVGASAFLELFKAFELNKKRFIFNPLPESGYYDELLGMNPTVINGDLSLIT
ncbi:hypothetical protein GW930_02795 [Candidatus Saccharibacteria bacterium]|nr:hypothetical protein [Candidatus Saccharibacteria bacterium]